MAALSAIRRSSPDTACLVLAGLSDEVEPGRAMEAWAAAIIHKSAEMSELLDAIRAVARRHRILRPQPPDGAS